MTDLMGDEISSDLMGWSERSEETVVLELQSALSFPPAEEAVDSRPHEPGIKRQRQEPHLPAGLPVGLPVGPSWHGQLPGNIDYAQGSRTPRQQALHVARELMQIARTEFEIFQVVRALALALGSVRTESGTIKAVHAVLLQLDRPGMSEKEAYTTTGASLSNFKKWRRRVHHAQLDLPPAP